MTAPRLGTGRLLTYAEAANRLNVTEYWLKTRVAARLVPHTKLGRNVRFTEQQIEEIIAGAAQPPSSPIPADVQ